MPRTRPLPSISRLCELFSYDRETGELTRRIDVGRRCKAGQVVGTPDSKGYLVVGVDGSLLKAHRIIAAIGTGEWPSDEIDHANGCKSDNRWDNLRSATRRQNAKNRGKQHNNTSGVKGVSWDKKACKWKVHIMVDWQDMFLGVFADKEAAVAAYRAAAMKHHGDFARLA